MTGRPRRRDAEAFAAAVVRLTTDDELWQRIRRRARLDAVLGTAEFAARLKSLVGDVSAS